MTQHLHTVAPRTVLPRTVLPRTAQSGRTLIELMIAMLIALIALAAVMLTVQGSALSGDQQDAQARLNEEAAIAANLLTGQLRLAGFSPPRLLTGSAMVPDRHYPPSESQNPPVLGCENGLAAALPAGNITALGTACVGGTADTAADALVVRYEGTTEVTLPSAAGLPTDCLADGVAATAVSPISLPNTTGLYSLIENRFFIRGSTLMCAGPGNTYTPQPIIDNVTDMQVTYGVADLNADGIPLFTPTRYLRADEVNTLAGGRTTEDNWRRVVSVRICLMMQTPDGSLSQSMPAYTDCRGAQQIPTDRAYRKAVNITVALRNRTSPCASNDARTGRATQDPSLCTQNP